MQLVFRHFLRVLLCTTKNLLGITLVSKLFFGVLQKIVPERYICVVFINTSLMCFAHYILAVHMKKVRLIPFAVYATKNIEAGR